MIQRVSRYLAAALAVTMLCTAPAFSAPIPSKAEVEVDAEAPSREEALSAVKEFLARDEVARALSARGFDDEQIESRLAQLTDEDLRGLASNLAQIQAAGEEVPEYIWWLAGGLLAVLILVAIF